MSEEEILREALLKAVEVSKRIAQKKGIGFHDLYVKSVEMAEHISYHAVKGVFPEKIFANRSPNQTDKEHKYIKENYKQHTLPVFIDYISTITRPFGDGNWSIAYREEEELYKDQGFQTYVESELPKYGSLENFIKFILPSIKSIDANGYITIRPEEIEYKEGADGQPVIDGEKLYKPTIYYFSSKETICQDQDYYLFLSKDKSKVMYGGREQKEGLVFELYTKDAVFFINQVGNKTDNKFEAVEYYRHNLNEFPVQQLMGVPNLQGDHILWQSPFLYSVDLLDIVTMNANWLQASINKCVYPHVVMFGSLCEYKDSEGNICNEGYIHINGEKHHACPSCGGQGIKSRLSPLGTMLINPATRFEAGETSATQEPLRFISPEVHTLEFIDKKIESDTLKARSILHLRNKNSTTTTQGDKTATEVFDDAKGTTAFVMPIAHQIFMIYEFCLEMIGKQRYEKFAGFELNYPKTCDFKSPEDYLTDIGNAIKNNLPPSFIQTILMQYINSFYGDNENTTLIFKLVMASDRLFGLSQDEINMKLAKGTVAKWEDILHSSALSFINDSIEKYEDFLVSSIESQIDIIQKLAKDKAEEISGVSINDLTGTTLPATASNSQQQPVDNLGKIPLGLQQLALASARAEERGNTSLVDLLDKKMTELAKSIEID